MKCSKKFRKGLKHMRRHRGKFLKHLMRRMDGYESCSSSSSSSSSSDEDRHRNQSESESCRQQRKEHDDGMKSKLNHDIGRKRGDDMMHRMRHGMMHRMRHGHGMMHRMRHGHGMMHRMRHGNDMMDRMRHGLYMRHGDDMMERRRHGHEMMHGMRHNHGRKHDHGMRHHGHWHDRHELTREHRMRHHHGMRHKMDHHHGHGRRHKMGHGPGMHHKLRQEGENAFPVDQSEEILLVDIENPRESSESDDFTFYKPKTSAQVTNENNMFQISLETSHYQPEEVSVKIADGKIDVSAMHESMEDEIYEFHEMYRSFNIPNNVNPEVITARLDSDGKLIIEAAYNDQEESSPIERDVPVIRVSE